MHVDALSCPRCSRPGHSVATVVLAFLTDPDVVGRILPHLGLPTCAPALAPASWAPSPQHLLQQGVEFSIAGLGDVLSDEGGVFRTAKAVRKALVRQHRPLRCDRRRQILRGKVEEQGALMGGKA